MFPLPDAPTANMTLDAVLAQLSRHPLVDGLVTVGTTGRDSLTPCSDYDLLVVLAEMPAPLSVGITYIDHRLTDLLFASTAQVEQIVAAEEAIAGDEWVGRIARWLMAGQVVFDRHGRVREAQAKVCGGAWIRPLEEIDAYGAWIGVNYFLLHTRRMIQSDDPVYRQAAELRIALYGATNLIYSYFRVRKLPWEGDKAAIRHLMAHDMPYLELLQRFLREPDPQHKLDLYEQLAAATLAPLSALWNNEPTVLWNDSVPATREAIEQGLRFWEALLGNSSAPGSSK